MSKDDFADEILSDEELDNVTGGTYDEVSELNDMLAPRNNDTARVMSEEELKNWLKENLNIDATFYNDKNTPNVYTRDGKTLTQSEVLFRCFTKL
ncbi:MAG: hypothetical protein IKN27_12250 [Selenomonadaceae bacterium]|nr:hypothetical protein [Selenomonadaceae bacterium]